MVFFDAKAQSRGFRVLFVPASDAPEAALGEGIAVYPVASLAELVQHLNGRQPNTRLESQLHFDGDAAIQYPVEFQDVKGQEHAKRALEVACAGGHNCLLKSPLGAGKTLLARALPSVLPRLNLAESLDITRIYSVAGALMDGQPLVRTRPFRAPHHTTPSATPAWWAAGTGRGRARSPWPIEGSSFWTSYLSSARATWRRCASRWRTG